MYVEPEPVVREKKKRKTGMWNEEPVLLLLLILTNPLSFSSPALPSSLPFHVPPIENFCRCKVPPKVTVYTCPPSFGSHPPMITPANGRVKEGGREGGREGKESVM